MNILLLLSRWCHRMPNNQLENTIIINTSFTTASIYVSILISNTHFNLINFSKDKPDTNIFIFSSHTVSSSYSGRSTIVYVIAIKADFAVNNEKQIKKAKQIGFTIEMIIRFIFV